MPYRLDHEIFGTNTDLVVQPLVEGIGRDNRQMNAAVPCRAHPAQGLPAIDAGHGQVHEDHIGLVACGEQVQAVMPAGGGTQFKTHGLQQLHQQFAVGLLVVHHQQLAARPFISYRLAPGRPGTCALHRTRSPMYFWQKQPDPKHRALAGHADHGHLATHEVCQHFGHGQAQAGARCAFCALACRAPACKRLKNLRQLGRAHARAGVFNLDMGHLARIPQPESHLTLGRELDGIA